LAFNDKKQGKNRWRGAQQIAELMTNVLDPIMQQRAGMTMQLVMAWEDIVGNTHSAYTRPEKLDWPKQAGDDEPFQPAALVIACDGARSIYLQHDSTLIIQRVNGYFGFNAIDRIKIVQKPVNKQEKPRRPAPPTLELGQRQRLDDMLGSVEDENLKQALAKMGEGVFSKRS